MENLLKEILEELKKINYNLEKIDTNNKKEISVEDVNEKNFGKFISQNL